MNSFGCLPSFLQGKREELTDEKFMAMFKKKDKPQGLILLPDGGEYTMYQFPAEIVKGLITLSSMEDKKAKKLSKIQKVIEGPEVSVLKVAMIKDVLCEGK